MERRDDKRRGVEVLSYWSQEYGAKIVSGAHAVHIKEGNERNNNVQHYCTRLPMDWLIANVCGRAKSRGKE